MNDEEDEQHSIAEISKAEIRLEAIKVELNQTALDHERLINEVYDDYEETFVCQYCNELIINKLQVINWKNNFYHLQKCLTKAVKEKLML